MSVYVDDARIPYGRLLMCHCVADTREELLAMMTRIGIDHRWVQHAGTWSEHFDLCLCKRARAIHAGAIEVTSRELVARMHLKQPAQKRPEWIRRVIRETAIPQQGTLGRLL